MAASTEPSRFALLGDPVDRSRSPSIHAAALAATGIDGRYEARRVDASGLDEALAEIRSGVLTGANVTMPHKARIVGMVDHLAEDAQRAGAVNTIERVDDRLVGWNTDIGAIRRALGSASGRVLILGAGGAAAAAAVAAVGREALVSARDDRAGADFAGRFGLQVVPWGEAVGGVTVINATPIGMDGEHLPPGLIEHAAGLIDLAYGDDPTPAVAEAQERGLPVVDGIELLVDQAAESFTIWTGVAAPIEAMTQAARAG